MIIIIYIVIILIALYFLWRNNQVYKYRLWFNDKCYEYSMKQIGEGIYASPINREEIIGDYYRMAFSFRSLDKLILDKEKYNKIVGVK